MSNPFYVFQKSQDGNVAIAAFQKLSEEAESPKIMVKTARTVSSMFTNQLVSSYLKTAKQLVSFSGQQIAVVIMIREKKVLNHE